MAPLRISKTDDTPEIILDKSKGKFEISGRSLPEDSVEFFSPVFQWLALYAKNPNLMTEFVFKLDYVNTASSKMVQEILSALEKIRGVRVVWHYHNEDEDMEEMGQELAELVGIPFEYKSI